MHTKKADCFLPTMSHFFLCVISGPGLDIYKDSINYWLSHSQEGSRASLWYRNPMMGYILENVSFLFRPLGTSHYGTLCAAYQSAATQWDTSR
jgi:hypothetical protein